MRSYRIGVIPGDGVGPEVIGVGMKVLDQVAAACDFKLEWHEFPFSARTYLVRGVVITDEEMADLTTMDAIYLGAVGDPTVPEAVIQIGGLLRMRFHFDEYINLRPIKLYKGVDTALKDKDPGDIDFVVVRENSEDFYAALGGRFNDRQSRDRLQLSRRLYNASVDVSFSLDSDEEIGYQIGVMSGRNAERVIRYGFNLARRTGRNRVTVVDKWNVLGHMYSIWRDKANLVATEFPGITLEFQYIDALSMMFVRQPERYQVVIAPNMFGDIITDLAAGISGGLGVAPSANINPERQYPSMFEPIHGSAPDIAGRGIANPIAAILAGAMMLDFLGEEKAARAVEQAAEAVLAAREVRTPDLGGTATTSAVGDAVLRSLAEVLA